ncbi:predicted protein [Naegleria gruberi]|uniref:Predicted protein n=1 Tax=Naegleria gruberi TaxID=5762 RepID=D2V921_NAEGR|nr:uncharacterized protein NAEGRDRAFT_65361 [Naegleria gruberi]EFC46901.1 predicted protein [Naegleria gruberi]|eukprot:XP_002679645.1 predicted protein [Naegleria gruberi strain NEG-M]
MSKRKKDSIIVDEDEEETRQPRVDHQSEEEFSDIEDEDDSPPPLSDSDHDDDDHNHDHRNKKKKKDLSKLKLQKPKNKTLDFNVFLNRIKSLQIDCECLNEMRDVDQLPNPSSKYLLNSCKLKNHQWQAVSWLKSLLLDNKTHGGILGDDMGLGKTLEVISFFCYWMESTDKESSRKPFLIVSPLSLIENWCLEFNKFCGNSVRVLRYHGNQEERAELQDTLNEEFAESGEFPYDVIVTSYETVTNDESFLSGFEYKCLCVDEAHRLKNPNSILYKALQQIYKYERVILMSGTPLMNNTKELWALLYFCAPTYFDHLFETFDSWFPQQCFLSKSTLKKSISESVDIEEDIDENVEDVDADSVRNNFQIVLKPFLLRRTKNQVLKNDLPPKEEHIIYTRLTTLQKKFYKGFLMADRNAIGKKNSRGLSNVLMSLRKCCDHPYMFEGAEEEPFVEGEHIVNNSGKMIILDKLLKKLKQEGHKVLIFSQMTQMLDILQDYFSFRKWNYERLDGSVRGEERFEAIKSFTDKDVFVFLLSTRAGGVGLNLTSADTVIFMDMDMNPQMDLQAQARCHRIGQDKPVTVYRLVTESSVEEVILKRSMKKIALSINTIDTSSAVSNAFDSSSDEKLSSDTIMEMISFGLHKIMDSTSDVSAEESDEKLLGITIDELLAKKGPKRLSLSLESAAESLQDVESGSIYMYDGIDYRPKTTSSSKDVEALQNLLGDAGIDLCSQKTDHHTKSKKKKAAPKKKPKKKEVEKDESLILSPSDDEDDDGYISPISTRTRGSKRNATTKRRKIKTSDDEDEESEYDEFDPHLIEIPDDWELDLYLMEKQFNKEEDDEPFSPITSDSNTIQYVKGDVTQPEKYEHSGTRFIVNVISDFGQFPNAGISKHITSKYGKKIKLIYENACEQDLISVGEAQLTPVKSKKGSTYIVNVIAQHYEKSKGHGPIINSALEIALAKVCYSAVTMDATVHMPRIGFGIQGFDWYSTERIIKVCLLFTF